MIRTFLFAPLIGACTLSPGGDRVVERRTVDLALGDETSIELVTRAGELEVIGEIGRTTIEMDVDLVRSGVGLIGGRSDVAGVDALVATLVSVGDRIEARSFVDLDVDNPFGTDVVLRVPAELSVTVRDSSGDLSVFDVASLDLEDASGDLQVQNVAGPVSIDDDSGRIDVFGTGPLTISDGSGGIVAEDIDGDVRIDDASGDVEVSLVTGDVDIDDQSGEIVVTNVTGTVRIDDDSGDIIIEGVGDFELRSDGSGNVVVR